MFLSRFRAIVTALLFLPSLSTFAANASDDVAKQAQLEQRIDALHRGYARAALNFSTDEEQHTFFTDVVHPILEARCFRCHGEEKQKGELRLDSLTSALQGGERGTALVPKDAAKSLLIEAIQHTNEDLKMPKEKLPQGEIDVLSAWVSIGAPWPAASEPEVVPAAPSPKPRKAKPIIKMALDKGAPVSFSRDIRPILSENCFTCHGPDEQQRKAGLRLDLEQDAFKALAPGFHAIVPGDIEQSLIFQRIVTQDEDDIMPPVEFPKTLSQDHIELIGRWILQGAQWETHWAFATPDNITVPQVEESEGWAQNPIDQFVLQTLEQKGFTPNNPSDKRTLARRATLDLTGLPPLPADVEAFVNDASPDAYEKFVDGLLASPQYGEHMARIWLDAARYADTNGYHIDNTRNMWRWREWVIDAYNSNKPFDEFTIEQLAGDLLETPTTDQLIATGFNRNHMVNFEGGAIPEEYRVQYVSDRLETTGTVWMGLTLNCAKCHDHKYDPISQKEYYQLFAFFNTVAEKGLDGNTPTGNAEPMIDAPNMAYTNEKTALQQAYDSAKTALYEPQADLDAAFEQWKKDMIAQVAERWSVVSPTTAKASGTSTLAIQEDGTVLASGDAPEKEDYTIEFKTSASNITALKLDALTSETHNGKVGRFDGGNFVLTEFTVEYANPEAPDTYKKVTFVQSFADVAQPEFPIGLAHDGNAETGWAPDGAGQPGNRTAVFVPSEPFGFPAGTTLRVTMAHQSVHKQHLMGQLRLSATEDPAWSAIKADAWYTSGPYQAETKKQAESKNFVDPTAIDLQARYDDQRAKWSRVIPDLADDQSRDLEGGLSATYFYRTIHAPVDRPINLKLGASEAIRLWVNGELIKKSDDDKDLKENTLGVGIDLKQGSNEILLKVISYAGTARVQFSITNDPVSGGIVPHLLTFSEPESTWRDAEKDVIYRHYRASHWDQWTDRLAAFTEHEKALNDHIAAMPKTMVMGEMGEPRDTFILKRGDYASPLDQVIANTPASLPPIPAEYPKNRLGFAKWLVDKNNPLTSRVTVNRIWTHFFGQGLVTTPEDFGSQGARPSHPELLDWLSQDFVNNGWDVKALHKKIMMSSTYKQSSKVSPEKFQQDTKNVYLARGSRFRVDAEVVRDSALAISGLLVDTIGGESVLPYQPAGLWKEVGYGGNFTGQVFEQDSGDDLYRRSMYTFWKRTSPPPSMMIFDAPNRETCSVSRSRSNTPLQALTLMNDPQFVEAARALGQRMIEEGGRTVDERIDYAFQLATARHPNEREKLILANNFSAQMEAYTVKETQFEDLLQVGDSEPNSELDKRELAAFSVVASMILNLDETITRN